MRILKFGGTSVANPQRIHRVANIIRAALAEDRVIVVVSALAGITDLLIQLTDAVTGNRSAWRKHLGDIRRRHLECLAALGTSAETDTFERAVLRQIEEIEILCSGIELVGQCSPEVRERILASGERLSAPIVAATLQSTGVEARAVDGADLIRATDEDGHTLIDLATTTNLVRGWLGSLKPAVVPVVTGFVAGDSAGHTKTLGRGGSDLTASVLGAAADATRVEIWTDVSGIMTAPPHQVENANTIPRLSYEEAAEMAFFGATVLHRDTLAPVAERAIPIWVRNTLAPDHEGTIVSTFGAKHVGATAIAAVGETTVLTIQGKGRFHCPGASRRLGELVAALQPEALVTSQASSEQDLTVIVPKNRAHWATELVRRRLDGHDLGLDCRQQSGVCLVVVVAHDLQIQSRVTARALETLDRHGLRLLATASSRHSVTFALEAGFLDLALDVLHDNLISAHASSSKESPDVSPKEGRRARRYRQRRPAVRSSVA